MTLVSSSRITRLLARLTLGVAVASLLSACFPLVMGGAVVGHSSAASPWAAFPV